MNDIRRIVAQGISPLYEMGVRDERERMSDWEAEMQKEFELIQSMIRDEVKRERERIIELIKGAPVTFEWFQPFVGTKTLIEQINEGIDGENV